MGDADWLVHLLECGLLRGSFSPLTTMSARAMVEALIDGERRPAVLADLAKGARMRSKIG